MELFLLPQGRICCILITWLLNYISIIDHHSVRFMGNQHGYCWVSTQLWMYTKFIHLAWVFTECRACLLSPGEPSFLQPAVVLGQNLANGPRWKQKIQTGNAAGNTSEGEKGLVQRTWHGLVQASGVGCSVHHRHQGVHHIKVSIVSRCPSHQGVHHIEVSITLRCPSCPGVHRVQVFITSRCPSHRGVHRIKVSITLRCPSHQGVQHIKVSGTSRWFTCCCCVCVSFLMSCWLFNLLINWWDLAEVDVKLLPCSNGQSLLFVLANICAEETNICCLHRGELRKHWMWNPLVADLYCWGIWWFSWSLHTQQLHSQTRMETLALK